MNLPPSRLCRARFGAAAFIAWASAAASFAQTAAAPSPTAKKPEDETSAVIMSPFEVIMTQDKGYQTGNSANALKTDEKIMEIPQSITVLTRSMIEDLGSGNLSDVLNYAGVGNVFQGDTAVVRGQRVNMLTDGSGDGQQQGPTFDSSMIDSITIVRGPAAVLYGLQSSLGGMIQKNTRIPLPKRGGTIIFQADEFGLMRGEVDFSTPLGQVGQSKFSMRTDLSYQDGKSFFKNSDNDRSVGYLALQMQRPETTIRVNGSYQTTKMIPHRNIFLSPDGTPYAGAGREQDYQPPGMKVERVDHNVRGQVLQRLFPGWDLQARGTFNRNSYSQGVMLGNLADFQNREARFTARWNRLAQKIYVGDLAVLGKYTLLDRKAESFLGGSMNDTTNKPSYFPGDPTFGIDNASRGVGRAQANNILAVSMDAPPIESIRIRQENAYYPILPTTAGNRGVRQSFVQHNLFYQQKIELVPNRLTLTASLSKFRQENTTENLTEPAPPTLTATAVQRQNRLLHRVGLVYNLTNSIVLYAIESTTINVQTSRLIDGGITPPQDGKQREVGIKTDFANGKLSLTASLYDIRLTNVGVNAGGVSPITGASYVVLIGKTKNQGGDIVLSARPLPNWYLTLNYDQHFVHDQNDNGRLPNTNTGSAGMFTRWDFKQESLKKWAIGGGANRFFNRFTGGSTIRFADGSAPAGNGTAGSVAAIRLKDGTGATLFIDYKATKKLTLKLTVNNLFDEFYAVGAQHAFSIDPSLPRNLMFSAYYRF